MATGMTILTSVPTAFVFSGGASLGACQAGMLEALFERRIRPDLLVGTSVGAINAAFVASRPPSVQTARELQRIWRGLRRGQVFPANPVTASLGLLGLRDHSVSAASLRRVLMRHLGVDRLEQADVPLHVVTTDFISDEEVLLTTGPALDAILASAAIPGSVPSDPLGVTGPGGWRDREQHTDLARRGTRRRPNHRAARARGRAAAPRARGRACRRRRRGLPRAHVPAGGGPRSIPPRRRARGPAGARGRRDHAHRFWPCRRAGQRGPAARARGARPRS